ncbi:MAG TPA: cupredoxin domain-containing protein [Patescibacteria group bacterium]|nr:cupredoxin domain-containing protein [Patescibacteria group bacterium]
MKKTISYSLLVMLILATGYWMYWTVKTSPRTQMIRNNSTTELMDLHRKEPAQPTLVADNNSQMKISIKNFAFNPNAINVNSGTTVMWINNDNTAHTVTGDGFNSGQIQPGGNFQFTFNSPGTYTYHCSIDPSMTGKIIVK